MAKRKNAIALFEVITATKRKELEAEQRQSLGTSRWWFKRKGNGDASADDDPTSPSYVATALPQAYAATDPTGSTGPAAAPEYDPTMPPPAPMMGQREVTSPEAAPAESLSAPQRPPQTLFAAPSTTVAQAQASSPPLAKRAPRNWGNWFGLAIKKVGLDPDRQEVTVRFRYTTAVLAGFALLVALGLAFVMGRRSGAPVASDAPSTEEIREGPVLAKVLNPDDGQIATIEFPADPPPLAREGRKTGAAPRGSGSAAVEKDQSPPDRWAAAETRLPRIIGLNYVIMQSYHDRKAADAACDALIAAGIPATVERAPKSWSANPNLFSVIGTHGFARPKTTPKFRQYKEAATGVGNAFAGKSKYLQFDPSPYQWKQEDEDARRKAKKN